jgi:hypothetical protein
MKRIRIEIGSSGRYAKVSVDGEPVGGIRTVSLTTDESGSTTACVEFKTGFSAEVGAVDVVADLRER